MTKYFGFEPLTGRPRSHRELTNGNKWSRVNLGYRRFQRARVILPPGGVSTNVVDRNNHSEYTIFARSRSRTTPAHAILSVSLSFLCTPYMGSMSIIVWWALCWTWIEEHLYHGREAAVLDARFTVGAGCVHGVGESPRISDLY